MTTDFDNSMPAEGNSGRATEAAQSVGRAVSGGGPNDLGSDDGQVVDAIGHVGGDFAARENLPHVTPPATAAKDGAADTETHSAPVGEPAGAMLSPARRMLEARLPLCEEAGRQLALSNGTAKARLVAFLQSVLAIRRSNEYDLTELEAYCRDRGIALIPSL